MNYRRALPPNTSPALASEGTLRPPFPHGPLAGASGLVCASETFLHFIPHISSVSPYLPCWKKSRVAKNRLDFGPALSGY